MGILDEIFAEYVRMRASGLDTREVLKALRAYIEPLPQGDKELLAQQLKAWERDQAQAAPPPKKSSVVKPLSSQPAPPQDALKWVECRHCGKKNRPSEVFCYGCGHLLETDLSEFDTRQFADAADQLFNDEYFGPDSILLMEVRDTGERFELRPQARQHEIVIGRSTENSAMRPDIDLTAVQASQLGVSRLHLALRYEPKDNTLHVYDLGSANGSYINGQRLHPRELRLLRNHDEVRLGRLVLRVHYYHPGEEIRN
jgi:hypothetical protein